MRRPIERSAGRTLLGDMDDGRPFVARGGQDADVHGVRLGNTGKLQRSFNVFVLLVDEDEDGL